MMQLGAVLLVSISAIITCLVIVVLFTCFLKRLVNLCCKTKKTGRIDAQQQQQTSAVDVEAIPSPPPSYEEIMNQQIYIISVESEQALHCYSYRVDDQDDLLPTYDQIVAAGYHHYSHSQQQSQ